MRDYRQSLSVWSFTADWVWSVIKSSYLLPNQLSASNGIPSLIELSLLLPGDIYCNLMKIFFTVVSRKKLDSIKRGSVGNTRLLPHAEMLLVPMKFFLWRIDYALQEKVLTWKMCFLPLISFWEREQRISSKAWALSVVPHFSLSPPRLAFLVWVDFQARSRFPLSTIPEENGDNSYPRELRALSFCSKIPCSTRRVL